MRRASVRQQDDVTGGFDLPTVAAAGLRTTLIAAATRLAGYFPLFR